MLHYIFITKDGALIMSFFNFLNNLFPPQPHPFNMQNDGKKTYAQWQYEKGMDTIVFYMDKYTTDDMFKDKTVLDFGCGAGGKSLYYASIGAKKVVGVDIVESYREKANAFAQELGLADKFEFHVADATALPFEDHSFDTIIMNDFMEHVNKPEEALKEALRIIKPDGKIFINFPPYYHPMGAHLTDVIYIPWVHMLFSEQTLIREYKERVKDKPDGANRISFRFSKDENGKEYISYINKMTLKRFHRILKNLNITPVYYKETALRSYFKPLAHIPGVKEMFVKMAACVITPEKNEKIAENA